MEQSSIKLLNKYVEEYSDTFTTNGELLFCKVCNISVSFNRRFLVEQHLRTQKHIDKYAQSSEIKIEIATDILEKYVSENSKVFETDGQVLFCKACNTLVTFGKKSLVDQHLKAQKHIENSNELNETNTLSNTELLNKYVSENGDIYETDGKKLFCKICKISVPFDKQVLLYRHLTTRKHINLYKNIKTQNLLELLNKYVTEHEKVLETDGKELFCKICKKSVSFETKFCVLRHLKSKKHIEKIHEKCDGTKNKSTQAKWLTKFSSENNEVFETDGEILFCKICKTSVSFQKKSSVDQHIRTQKHIDNLTQTFENTNQDTTAKELQEGKKSPLRRTTTKLLQKYVTENKNVFESDGEVLFCKVCRKSVSFDKKFSVEQHLKTQKHKYNVTNSIANATQNIITEDLYEESTPICLELNENFCRTCMKQFSKTERKGAKQRITEVPTSCENSHTSLRDLLEFIQPQIKVEIKESLPIFMCSDCIQKLIEAYEFIEMYQNVDKKLRIMLEDYYMDGCSNNLDEQQDALEETEVRVDLVDTKYEIEIEQINIDVLEPEGNGKINELSEFENELCDTAAVNSIESVQNNELSEFEHELSKDAALNNESDGSDDDWMPKKSWFTAASPEKQKSDASKNSPKSLNKIEENSQHQEFDDESLQCSQCESVFDSVKRLREHVRQNHAERKAKRPYNKRKNEPRKKGAPRVFQQIPSKQGGSYQCEYCEKRYSNYIYYRQHMRLHPVEPLLCIECGKSFTRLSSFNTHMLRHKGEKKFQCPKCPKSFVCSSGLYGHMMVHNDNKPYVCDTCGAAFHMPYQLRHHNLYHAGIKKFKCDYCEMKFVTREKQRRHMRIHTGEKPYRCKYCERAFAQSNDCVKHLRQHLGDNVYQCDLCPLRFPLVRDLRVHFATHKDDDEETRSRNLQARMEEEHELKIRLSAKNPE